MSSKKMTIYFSSAQFSIKEFKKNAILLIIMEKKQTFAFKILFA